MKSGIFTAWLFVSFMLVATPAFACHERVHVEDSDQNPMVDVEVRISSIDCNWNAKTTETQEDGWTPWKSVEPYCTYKAEVISGADGYVCNTDTDYNDHDNGEMFITCVPTSEVPEFTTLGAGLTLFGAGAIVLLKKRR